MSSVLGAETGQRGFLLTGDQRYLQPYLSAVKVIPGQLRILTSLTTGHPEANRIARLESAVNQKLRQMELSLETRRKEGSVAALDLLREGEGRVVMEDIRKISSELMAEEYAGLTERSRLTEFHVQRTRLFTVLGSATLFMFLLVAGGVIASAAAQRERLIAELRASEKSAADVRDLMGTTLASIGDGVIATDLDGRISFINPVAQALTGCTHDRAKGRPLDEIFRIVHDFASQAIESPVTRVLRDGKVAGPANHTVLLGLNGAETPIDHSGAPIRDSQGATVGVVLVFRDITERKKAQEASLRLAAIVESSDDAIIAHRLDGIITSWNAAAARMFGYSAEEAVGRNFSIVIPPESREDLVADMERIRRGAPGIFSESTRRRKDGYQFEVATSMSPIRDAEGNVIGVSRISRDITDRRRAEEEHRRSSKQISDILESIQDGFVAIDSNWVFTYVNAEAERVLGKARSELVGKNYWEEYPAAREARIGEFLHRASAERTPIHFEEFFPELQGWFEAHLYPSVDGGVAVYFRNITERKKTQEALRDSEERLRLSAEAAQIGAWSLDLAAGTTRWSPQMENLFGLAPGAFERSREHFLRLIHPEDRNRVMEAISRAVDQKSDFDVEYRFLRPNGETGWMLTRGTCRCDDSGAPVSLEGVAIDITRRKRLEEKMQQSQKLESLGVLAGGIAHDFNNLLVGILGNAGFLMEETPADSPHRPVIENLLQAGERAAHLTRQMLAYSGKGRFVIERLNLEVQVRQILALIAASIPKGVRVDLDFQPDLPPIEGDSGQLQQLIMNLVINGAEAIGSETGVVTVSTRLREIDANYVRDNRAGDTIPPGLYVLLEVHDNGVGMDAATQARIFDPFFTTKFTGRGLGLAAVLGIVRGHKGALTVYSQPGSGTTFKVFLPVLTAPQPPAAAVSDSEFRGQATILVVDDESVVRNTVKAALERYGYTVILADGGEQAVTILQEAEHAIALALLDMTMPTVSGEETLRRLLSIQPDLPVIATSGYNEVEALRRFGDGLSGFIQKPFTPRRLAEKIRTVLGA
jgi:PAS domain S-box-containing protein